MLKILGGNAADPDTSMADGEVNWNFSWNWELGSDFDQEDEFGDKTEIDFISTGIHELTHALGFASDIKENGKSGWDGEDPRGNPTAWSPFDEFVADSTGALINSSFAIDGSRWDTAKVGGTGGTPGAENGLLFIGSNAMAANGNAPVFLYSPVAWSGGSSGSHLDTAFYDGTNGTIENMMNHESTHSTGLDIREYTAIEIGVLKDIGYTEFALNAVPEVGQSALILALAFMGFSAIRRKRMAMSAAA